MCFWWHGRYDESCMGCMHHTHRPNSPFKYFMLNTCVPPVTDTTEHPKLPGVYFPNPNPTGPPSICWQIYTAARCHREWDMHAQWTGAAMRADHTISYNYYSYFTHVQQSGFMSCSWIQCLMHFYFWNLKFGTAATQDMHVMADRWCNLMPQLTAMPGKPMSHVTPLFPLYW